MFSLSVKPRPGRRTSSSSSWPFGTGGSCARRTRTSGGGGEPRVGVPLIRFPAAARKGLPDAVLRVVRDRGDRLMGPFAVAQPGRVRIAGARKG